jgi:hypothetical protein
MAYSRMLRRVALVRTDVSEELCVSIIKVTRIGELGTLTVTSNLHRLLVTANVPSSPILVTLMMEALSSPKRRFLQEPHGVTSQKTPFFTGYPDINSVYTGGCGSKMAVSCPVDTHLVGACVLTKYRKCRLLHLSPVLACPCYDPLATYISTRAKAETKFPTL